MYIYNIYLHINIWWSPATKHSKKHQTLETWPTWYFLKKNRSFGKHQVFWSLMNQQVQVIETTVHMQIHPGKSTASSPKNHPIGKEIIWPIHLHVGVQNVNFPGYEKWVWKRLNVSICWVPHPAQGFAQRSFRFQDLEGNFAENPTYSLVKYPGVLESHPILHHLYLIGPLLKRFVTLPETNSKNSKNGWLEDDPFLLGLTFFRG